MAHGTATAWYTADEEEDDEDVCRICKTPGDTDKPLQYPCACRGSIKFVHQDCLLQWLSYSKAHKCEVCKHRFSFSPLYAEKAPTRLPLKEFIVGAAMKVWRCRALHFSLRLFLLLWVWSLIIPFITFWIWRLAFVRSFREAQRLLFLSHVSTTVFITDCLLGLLISVTIIYILRGAASLSNYFSHLHRNFEFDELVELQSPLFRLFKIAFTVPASNMIFLGVFIFVPFTLGRVILYHVASAGVTTLPASMKSCVSNLTNEGQESGPSKLYDVTALTVGYMFVVLLVLLYLGIIALIRYFKGESLSVPPLLWQFLEGIRLGTIAVLSVLLVGVLPLMCGWLLDVCTVQMFGKTLSQRVDFWSVSPLASSLVHWLVGALYLWAAITFEDSLRELLRPEALRFLNDPADEFDKVVRTFARCLLFDYAKDGSLIVLLVFLPVKLAIMMAPSVFPLDISVSDPFTEIPAGILLFIICTLFIIDHSRFWTTVKSLVRCWLTSVGLALGLTDFLLPRPDDNVGQDNGNGEPGRQNRGAESATVDLKRSPLLAGNVEQSDPEYSFVLRVVLLLLAAWVTLLLFNTAMIVVPVSLGRALLNAIPITHGIKCNDLYAFVIGTYAFWTVISGTMYAIEHVKSERTSVFLNQIWKWCGMVFKSSALLAIWVFIIPVLIGLLFELLVIVPVDESHVFLLYQDWALGIILLKIWTRLIILLDGTWRAKFARVREDGFSRLQGLWVLKEIVLPIVMKLLTALCVPYVLARGVFPMLGYPLVVNSAVYRYAWIVCLSVSLFCFLAKRFHVWFRNLHSSIRDDRYLIGRRLHNFGEAVLAQQN